MKTVIHLLPHLSTGGCPQYAYDLIRKTKDDTNAWVIEYSFISADFVVQRNRIIDLMGERFIELGQDKTKLSEIIHNINPDVIHFQEFPEYFMADEIAKDIYHKGRLYTIIETSHDSGFNPSNKRFFPDHFALISQWQIDKFKSYGVPITLLESDIEFKNISEQDKLNAQKVLGLSSNQKHILNVGLWTSRKNQGEVLEYAKKLHESNPEFVFHFVGNQAGNFQHYWQPLMENLPPNVKIWGERSDVTTFYTAMDLFLFTSRGLHGDMETSPLVLREATAHGMPILMYNLPVYLNYYDKFDNIEYLDWIDLQSNIEKIIKKTHMENEKTNLFRLELNKESNQIFIYYQNQELLNVSISIADIDSKHAIYAYDSAFENYSSAWATPIPVSALNKMNVSGYFRGYEVTFWNRQRDTIIEKHTVWYDENAPYFERVLFPTDPWNLTWINYTEMFVENFYNPLQMEITGTCLDIGANDGLYTEYLLRNGANKVYAVECDPRSVKFLNNRFNDNDKVVIVDKAMWSSNETNVKLSFRADTSTVSSLVHDSVEHGHNNQYNLHDGFFHVNTWDYKTLLSKMNISKVNFFKIDIEGAEYDVFKSMSDEDITNIDGFMVEIHWNDNGKIYQITDRLEQLGFEIELRRHTEDNALVEKENWGKYWLCTFYAKKKVKSEETAIVSEVSKNTKIKISHLQTTLWTDTEKQSYDSISSLFDYTKKFDFEVTYQRFVNEPFKDLPPMENCINPARVSMTKFPEDYHLTALTPAHYGCFKAFQDAVADFDENADFNIIFEGDAAIKDNKDFIEKFMQIADKVEALEIDFISFGGVRHLETKELISKPSGSISGIDWGYLSDHIPFAHCIIIPKRYVKQMKLAFATEPWDVTDLFLINHFYKNRNTKRFVSINQLAYQLDGFSLIDKRIKNYNVI